MTGTHGLRRTFCIAENRDGAEVGIRLAVASLSRHDPGVAVHIFAPRLSAGFDAWAAKQGQIIRRSEDVWQAREWNCKPAALMTLLDAGFDEVVWLDSDAMAARPLGSLLDGLTFDTLLVAQEPPSQPFQGTGLRTRGWGLAEGRDLALTLNSAVLRITKLHRNLLDRWHGILTSDRYQEIQRQPMHERPPHALSDQDILNALVGSEEFAALPLRILRSGTEIIHAGGALGYGVADRLRGLRGPGPYVLHAIAGKPWTVLDPIYEQWGMRRWFVFNRRLLQETSPYVLEARQYAAMLDMDCPWLCRRTLLGRLLLGAGLGRAGLAGLPLSIAASVVAFMRRPRRRCVGSPDLLSRIS